MAEPTKLPTIPELRTSLDGLLSLVLVNFAKMAVHPLMVKEVGDLLTKIDLSKQPTPEAWTKLLDDSAVHLLEEITLLELRSTIN